MSTSIRYKEIPIIDQEDMNIHDLVKSSFTKIAPFWPLQNLIAVNPLQGFEDVAIEDALKVGSAYFEQSDLPQEMLLVNIETIKWLGSYCDEGQATITMPLRKYGLYHAWRKLARYDEKLHRNRKEEIEFLQNLPETPNRVIAECLIKLNIAEEEQKEFINL